MGRFSNTTSSGTTSGRKQSSLEARERNSAKASGAIKPNDITVKCKNHYNTNVAGAWSKGTLNVETSARTNRESSSARGSYYARKSLRAEVFTRGSLYARKSLRAEVITRESYSVGSFYISKNCHVSFRPHGMSRTSIPGRSPTRESYYARKFLRAEVFTLGSYYARKLLRAEVIPSESYSLGSYSVEKLFRRKFIRSG